ncbi:hypothetical protein PL373_16015 [Tenacibaculum maritimum]|nr:hypothetical protein [Tenacibaculum maritimum]MDB0602608.1 hypothetical protein [Tenacibaculum maritimum]
MSDFYEKLKKHKEDNNLTYSDLGKIISVSGDTFRMAMNRKSFSDIRKEKMLAVIDYEKNEQAKKSIENIFYWKDGVKIELEEMLSFFTINIKAVKRSGKLRMLIDAINSVENIDQYNKLSSEIAKIKKLLDRNKDILN